VTHRAAQIIEAVASAVRTRVSASGAKVYEHRRLSLSLEQDEMSAYSVDFGEDRRLDSQFMQMIDSELAVQVTALVEKPTEAETREALLDMRREQHRAVMIAPRLGLQDFVIATRYGGAEAPEFLTDGENIIGALTSIWLVHYRMELTDPGND
jgi:hypothetical protein